MKWEPGLSQEFEVRVGNLARPHLKKTKGIQTAFDKERKNQEERENTEERRSQGRSQAELVLHLQDVVSGIAWS